MPGTPPTLLQEIHLQATLNFLANRYSTTNGKYGRIVNWIVGNEVNNYWTYNYAGSKNLNQYAKVYADQFRLAYNALTSVYSNARVYISLDHLWNTNNVSGTFASRAKCWTHLLQDFVLMETSHGTSLTTLTVRHSQSHALATQTGRSEIRFLLL